MAELTITLVFIALAAIICYNIEYLIFYGWPDNMGFTGGNTPMLAVRRTVPNCAELCRTVPQAQTKGAGRQGVNLRMGTHRQPSGQRRY